MKVVVQRVKNASVTAEGKILGAVNKGLCVLVGVEKGDSEEDARFLARKIVELRIFGDAQDKMNLSLLDIGGEMLAVSQFTLAASLNKGRRPGFDRAELPGPARKLFDYFVACIREQGVRVETGEFAAVMEVALVNEGPVTFVLDSLKASPS